MALHIMVTILVGRCRLLSVNVVIPGSRENIVHRHGAYWRKDTSTDGHGARCIRRWIDRCAPFSDVVYDAPAATRRHNAAGSKRINARVYSERHRRLRNTWKSWWSPHLVNPSSARVNPTLLCHQARGHSCDRDNLNPATEEERTVKVSSLALHVSRVPLCNYQAT